MNMQRIQIKPGYYGMAISSVHDRVETIGRDNQVHSDLYSILAASDSRLAIFAADNENELFWVVQQLPNGGIISALSGHAVRGDTPEEAFAAVTREMADYPERPLLVTWLENIDRVMH
jgi:hypothetical protein